MTAKKKNFILLAVVVFVLIALVIWIIWGNTALEQNIYTISSSRLPEMFDGYRIAHISDLHNTSMGENNEKLLDMLREAEPDIIVITGDLIDSRHTNVEVALQFAQEAMKIAPCYYISGNHEARVDEYDELKCGLIDLGVIVLEDSKVEISIGGETITLIGVHDPSFQTDYLFGNSAMVMNAKLTELHTDGDGFTVLLSHRPELFNTYVDSDVDLVLSGHAHGGLTAADGLLGRRFGVRPGVGGIGVLVGRGIGGSLGLGLHHRLNGEDVLPMSQRVDLLRGGDEEDVGQEHGVARLVCGLLPVDAQGGQLTRKACFSQVKDEILPVVAIRQKDGDGLVRAVDRQIYGGVV